MPAALGRQGHSASAAARLPRAARDGGSAGSAAGEECGGSGVAVWLTGLAALGPALLAAGPALADAADDAEAVITALDAGPGYTIEAVLVGVAFTAVVGLLAVVTAGIAYINIKQFLDTRQEQEDRDIEARKIQIPRGNAK